MLKGLPSSVNLFHCYECKEDFTGDKMICSPSTGRPLSFCKKCMEKLRDKKPKKPKNGEPND